MSATARMSPGRIETSTFDAASANARQYAQMDALMERYVDGDLTAFDELYALTAPRIRGALRRILRHREHDADDLLQVTFSKLHVARAAWVRGGRILPYLHAIARNSALDMLRSFGARRLLLTRHGELPGEAVHSAVPEDSGLSEAVARAVGELPVRYREAIDLTKWQELSLGDAALVVGTTEAGMKMRLHRAYKLLRTTLDRTVPQVTGMT